MASRAMLRRKRIVTDYVTASSRTTPGFQWLGHYHGSQKSESKGFSSIIMHMHRGNNDDGDDKVSVAKDEFRRLGFISGTTVGISHRWMSQSIRNASTAATAAAAAKQTEPIDDEENERLAAKKKKQASPEDCDQAVQGLSTAKAAKAKKLQESQKDKSAKPMLQKVWATFLGIGPALKAVASMSRLECLMGFYHFIHFPYIISFIQHGFIFVCFAGKTGPKNLFTGKRRLCQHCSIIGWVLSYWVLM